MESAEWTDFAQGSHAPENLAQVTQSCKDFLAQHEGKRIALVTSGGTTVPLERNTVRFLDNFSAGTRGSASSEQFMSEHGYPVIFLYRAHSLMPYSRHLCLAQLLDVLSLNGEAATTTDPTTLHALHALQKVKASNLLLAIPFVSVSEYLYYLREIAVCLSAIGSNALLYLAAAVSDFYLPDAAMSEHKIQSREGPLQITLPQVPKMLKPLVAQWCPEAFIVSFKLETDEAMLTPKAQRSLAQYGHQLVVANMLHTRKTLVILFAADGSKEEVRLSEEQAKHREIEVDLIANLVARHAAFITKQ